MGERSMNCKPLLIAAMWIGLFLPAVAVGQGNSTTAGEPDEKTIARIQNLLDEIEIETKDFKDKMPLAKLFATLEAKLPKDKKLTLHIDKDAFGADFAKVSTSEVQLVHGRRNEKTSLHSALARALRLLPKGVEADYGFRADGIVLTRPNLATHRMVYDIRDIAVYMPFLRKDGLGFVQSGVLRRQSDSDDITALVRLANNVLELRTWETIEILNRTRLVFSASPARHAEMRDLLSAIRRFADARVVMNARLYETDRVFYNREIAPLFAKSKQGEPAAPIQSIRSDLFKKITRQRMLLESEELKIHDKQSAVFLSRQSIFQYAGEPPILVTEPAADQPKKPEKKTTDSDLEGVTFEVTAQISPDRRYIQAKITQTVSQLIGVEKTKQRNPFTGNEIEIETPNLRKSTVTGTIRLADAQPILMPVEYHPVGKGKEDKMWLLLARPFIWIEEEARERGKDFNQKTVWDSEIVSDSEIEEEPRLGGSLKPISPTQCAIGFGKIEIRGPRR
jgi:hypothetical protein